MTQSLELRARSRYSDAQLKAFAFDMRMPIKWAKCPFCGGELVTGVRLDTRNLCAKHSGIPDPDNEGGYVNACERFREVASRSIVEWARLLRAAGVQWHVL